MNNLVKRSRKLSNTGGFTLVELIVVIVIIGILAAVLVPRLGGFTDKAKGTGALVEAKQIATAIDARVAEKGFTTTTEVTGDEANIRTLAGLPASGGTLTVTAIGADGVVSFTWKNTVKGKTFTVTRSATGDFTVAP